ncbi:MAG: hypothetical protein PVH50_07205 [Anaerolineae bacterium]
MASERHHTGRVRRESRSRSVIGWLAAVVTVVLAGCAAQQRTTPTALSLTPSIEATSPTPSITPTVTPLQPTATERTPTATPLPVTPAPGLTPTETPPPPTQTPSPRPAEALIHSFDANVDLADPGDTITLTWNWSGGDGATVYHLLPSGQMSMPSWRVGHTGSLQYTISPQRRNHDTFVLFVYDDEGVLAQDTVQIELSCPDEWFFSPAPDICPASPPTIAEGAEEHFERGTMLWVGGEDRVYVLFDDHQHPRWTAFSDEWHEGEPILDPEIDPPAGLYQPVRGFGMVWREESTVRERLGWAVDQERGYQTAIQRTSHYRYSHLYIRAVDGGVWRLGPNGGEWEHLESAW